MSGASSSHSTFEHTLTPSRNPSEDTNNSFEKAQEMFGKELFHNCSFLKDDSGSLDFVVRTLELAMAAKSSAEERMVMDLVWGFIRHKKAERGMSDVPKNDEQPAEA